MIGDEKQGGIVEVGGFEIPRQDGHVERGKIRLDQRRHNHD